MARAAARAEAKSRSEWSEVGVPAADVTACHDAGKSRVEPRRPRPPARKERRFQRGLGKGMDSS
jgi:hypothetical protein